MANAKKGLALILANSEYQSQQKLPSCLKDGCDMKTKLESMNFDVQCSFDATRQQMFASIGAFIALSDLYSVILVYYSGHGVQIDGENYFVPVDCIYSPIKSIFIGTALVGISTITDYFDEHPEKANIMILDACRTAPPFSRDMVGNGLAEIRAGNGTLIAFATSPNKVAYGAPTSSGNGYYTGCLLEHIDQPNVKVEDMFKEVRNDVVRLTSSEQIPWESTSLNEDFFFSTMNQDSINEAIYQGMRNSYSADTLILISKQYRYPISDVMRIYERQKKREAGRNIHKR